MYIFPNGKRSALCNLPIGSYTTLASLKQSVCFELNIDENTELSLYTYKGVELLQDSDLDLLPHGAILFFVKKRILVNNKINE